MHGALSATAERLVEAATPKLWLGPDKVRTNGAERGRLRRMAQCAGRNDTIQETRCVGGIVCCVAASPGHSMVSIVVPNLVKIDLVVSII